MYRKGDIEYSKLSAMAYTHDLLLLWTVLARLRIPLVLLVSMAYIQM